MHGKLRVLLISPAPPPVGGIATWTRHILHHFKSVDNIKLYHLNTALRYRKADNQGWFRVFRGFINFIDINRKLEVKLKECQPHVVHLTSSASLALVKDCFLLKKLKDEKIATVVHFRFGRIPQLKEKQNWEWKLLKRVVRLADTCIVIDQRSYQVLIDEGFQNVYNLPNPISPKLIKKARCPDFQSRKSGVVLFVGRVTREKGIVDLFNAVLDLESVNQLRILGPYNDKLKERLEQLATGSRGSNWVRFLGEQNSDFVMKEMRECGLFVLPSYTEGFPNVILEAMVSACPIVATEVGAIPEMLQLGSCNPVGVGAPVGDFDALREVIDGLIGDSERLRILGLSARRRVLEQYTLENSTKALTKIWRKDTKR